MPNSKTSSTGTGSSYGAWYTALITAHTFFESAAVWMFGVGPSDSLSAPAPSAHAVIRQYAAALLSLNLVLWAGLAHRHTLQAALAPYPRVARRLRQQLALGLSVYHYASAVRPLVRIARGQDGGLSGPSPWVAAAVHVPMAILLTGVPAADWLHSGMREVGKKER